MGRCPTILNNTGRSSSFLQSSRLVTQVTVVQVGYHSRLSSYVLAGLAAPVVDNSGESC